ncbi:hypothetical protein LB506_005014 [Fusarium annulatum]|nr:hypothetical protein LB506_005014 [Fusarium annulatum]
MADDAPDASPKNEPLNVETKEDAETRATRRELKQSSISDPPTSGPEDAANTSDAPDNDLKEQIASPKKKRAHDQLEGNKDAEENDSNSVASSDSAKDRALRTEPEKKRHRDEDADLPSTIASSEVTKDTEAGKSATKQSQGQTSASAFAASGFGKLSSGTSPFASLGASQSGSAFGSLAAGKPSLSSFASKPSSTTAQPAAPPKLTFGSSGGASPFAGLSTGSNGSPFGGSTFGSALGGTKPLSSFAAPGAEPLKSEKPAKPFGAPDSESEDGGEEEEEREESEQPPEAERAVSPEKESDEKKKLKLQKSEFHIYLFLPVEVNDGEAGEATVVSVRAKMFYHDKEAGWKERGAGMLKINVPQACVEYDENGAVIPGSFDASALEVDEEAAGESQGHKVARLIMRQDQTHRVILNTALVAAMKFQEKASLKSVGILFTAFEGEQSKPVSITMRMSAANAKLFMNEIGIIQKELQNS